MKNWLTKKNLFPYLLFLWLVLAGLSYLRQYHNIIILQQVSVPPYFLLTRAVINCSILLIYIGVVYYLSIYYPVHSGKFSNFKWHLALLILGLLIIPFWYTIVYYWMRGDMPNPYPPNIVYGVDFRFKILVLPFLHAFILIGQWVLELYKKNIEDQTVAIQRHSDLIRSKLNALKAKINPHFLFNTLQGINTVAYSDRDTAYQMLLTLKKLFKKVDENVDEAMVTLSEELDFNKNYLYLEKSRFRDKLNVEFDIAPEGGTQRVPKFILQPLIENSLKHILAKNIPSMTIRIESYIENRFLYVSVEDSGSSENNVDKLLNTLKKDELGFGLQNIVDRLSVIGNGAVLNFSKSQLGGLKNTIRLPLVE